MGGTYSTALNALVMAEGSNAPWVQSALANYLQAQGAQWIKEQFTEGSPEHLAAHALLACAGAAGGGGDCAGGALGAGTSVLLTQLIQKPDSEVDKQELVNLMGNMIAAGGLATGTNTNTINSALTANQIEMVNNGWNDMKETIQNLSLRPGDVKETWINYLHELADRGDLTDAEKHLYGIVYALSEAMIPESELEIAAAIVGGAAASKGISLLVRKYKFLGYPVSESIEMAMREWKLIKPGKPGGSSVATAGGKPGIVTQNAQYTNVLPESSAHHILYGERPGVGEHLWPGQPGKTPSPQNWNADKILHEVSNIATSPSTKWYAQTGAGGIYTSAGRPARWVAYEVRGGVRIRVVYEPATNKVVTAFPDTKPIPPYKPVVK